MNNGQWTIDNGQWTIDNGQWTIDNGQLIMNNIGCLKIDKGRGKVNNEKIK